MKILGISGSPRSKGNTGTLLRMALEICKERGAETKFISLVEREINYCTSCDACKKPPYKCIQVDDVDEILGEMKSSDAIIVASPTYFAAVSGKLKSLFDRTLPLRRDGYRLSGKIGGAIAVGGSRNGGQEHVCMQIHNWMLLQEMIVVSDKKTAHFGGIAVGRDLGDVLRDDLGISTIENLAGRVFDVTEGLKSNLQKG
jgi:multimeric flavodoxin WrbA